MVDLVAGRGEYVPRGAELLEPLAGGVAGLLVAGVVVERVAVVRHLRLPPARGRADLGGQDAAVRLRLPVRGQRRPEALARARAVAHVRLVGLEQVQGAPFGIDKDVSERRGAEVDGRAGG